MIKNIKFSKYSGHGNDFILIDKRLHPVELSKKQIIAACDRRFGVGADGIIFVDNAISAERHFRISIINCDGSEADMCGNAARIAVAYEANLTLRSKFFFETLNGQYIGEFINNEAVIYMSEIFDIDKYDISDLGILAGMYLNTGVPHTVIEVKNIESLDIVTEGQKIRYDQRFENGTNVCFFEVVQKNEIKFRVYERGVEGETHCCGTGVIASAITCKKLFNWQGELLVHCLGGEVYAIVDDKFKEVTYRGRVDLCFKGELSL